jgi:hypothetical protein
MITVPSAKVCSSHGNTWGVTHGKELLEEPEPEGWIARPITRDAARGCHFHDALDTLLRRAFD